MTEKSIPVGYKNSTVGIIPQEWEVKRLGEICTTFKSGNTITSSDIDEKGVYPVYGGNGLRGYTHQYTHDGDYVLIGRQGALCGNINYVNGKNYITEHAIAVQADRDNDLKYLAYKLYFWNLNRFSESSAQPGLSVEKLVRYKLAVPPLAEQQKIAQILKLWDKAIEKQVQLIKALEKRKQALMQRLLSGRTRLPGFTGEWKKEKLMDIGIFLSTNSFPRDKMNETEGTIMNVHYGDILIKYPTIVDLKTINVPYLNNGIKVKSDLLKDGDVIIADTAEDKIVGKAIEIVNIGTHQIVSGLHTFAFRPNESLFVNRFLGYYLNSVGYRKQLESLIQGIKVCSISKSSILNTYISIPLIKEQQAIVNILVSADDEIKRHNTKLSQLRKQKRGLMQQLLTGKKRVKE